MADLYSISYLYLGTIGFLSAFLIGSLSSFVIYKLGYAQGPEKLPKKVLFPAIDRHFPRDFEANPEVSKNSEGDEEESSL